MKNLFKKKLIIGYIGKNSVLAKSFVKNYNNKFKFKCYIGDINKHSKLVGWFKKNTDINIFINFAAITSPIDCEKYKKKIFKN